MKVINHLKGYEIFITPHAKRDLKKLEKKDAEQISDKLDELVAGNQNLDITPLEGSSEPIYRLRTGKFRIIYQVWKHKITVAVIEVGHRKEIYRKR